MTYLKTSPLDSLRLLRILQEKDEHALQVWLEEGYNPNTPYDKKLPLSRCIEINYEAGIRLLVQYGANPNGRNANNQPLLLEAIHMGNTSMITLLLSLGAEPNADIFEFLLEKYGKIFAIRLSLGESITKESLLQYL